MTTSNEPRPSFWQQVWSGVTHSGPSYNPQLRMAMDVAAHQRARDVAARIREELVCCDVYARVNYRHEVTYDRVIWQRGWHPLCYWGEASARIAEGRCPGRETTPDICRCDCPGCESSCAAHHPDWIWKEEE